VIAIIRSRRTQQPAYPVQPAGGSPFLDGLACAWIGAAPHLQLRSGELMTVAGATPGASGYGRGQSFSAAAGSYAQASAPRVNALDKSFSIVALGAPSASASQMKTFLSVGDISGGASYLQFAANLNWGGSASSGFLGLYATASSWYTSAHTASLIDSAPHVFGVTRLGGVASTALTYAPILYLDGRQRIGNQYVLSTADPSFAGFTATRVGNRAVLSPGTANAYDEASGLPLVLLWNRVLTPSEMFEIAQNPWQVFEPRRRRFFSFSGGAAELVGAGTGVATATASLTTAIQAAGGATGVANATGALTTEIPLNVAATVEATAAGALTAEIRFEGAALAVALATAALTTGIPLDGAAAAVAVATGALTTGDGLEGAAMVQALATADLSTAVQLASDAFAVALAQAGLTTGIPLQGGAAGTTLASATLTTQVQLAGAGAGVVTAVADLTGGSGSARSRVRRRWSQPRPVRSPPASRSPAQASVHRWRTAH